LALRREDHAPLRRGEHGGFALGGHAKDLIQKQRQKSRLPMQGMTADQAVCPCVMASNFRVYESRFERFN
jgi:hypothetical protein